MRLKRPLERALVSLGQGDDAGVQRRLCTRAPTVARLLTSDLELLARESGLDHAPLKQLAASVASASVQPVRTARQLLAARRADAPLLSTGVPALDALLQGGLRAGEVCELLLDYISPHLPTSPLHLPHISPYLSHISPYPP